MPARTFTTRRRAAGFTLMEILVAIGIMSIGAIAVASLFPSAIYLQKQAVNDTLRQQYIRGADGMLQGRGLEGLKLFEATQNITMPYAASQSRFDVYPLRAINVTTIPSSITATTLPPFADSLLARWTLADRSYPSNQPLAADREFYWVPLIQRGPEASELVADWNLFVFLTQPFSKSLDTFTVPSGVDCANPEDGIKVPKVIRHPLSSQSGPNLVLDAATAGITGVVTPTVGQKILGDNGDVLRIIAVDPSAPTNITVTPSPDTTFKKIRSVWYVNASDQGNHAFADLRELSNNIVRLPPLN